MVAPDINTRLRSWQFAAIAAVEPMLADSRPIVQAVMGAGKSVVIAELCGRAVSHEHDVVVTVPTQDLVRQLASSIARWTGLPVGQWYAGKQTLEAVTVVCQASIHVYEAARTSTRPRLWIADEAHRTECETMRTWDAPPMRVGFSATPWRSLKTESISAFDTLAYVYSAADAYRDGHIVKPHVMHASAGDIDEVVREWVHMMRRDVGGGVVNASSIADAEMFARSLEAIAVHSEGPHDADMARAVIRDGGVVVYVDMLAEGFDCPEIRWMALRRPVGSRVRFAQEVGRGLRAAPGKSTCPMLDVHDLWSVHSMSWQAALGETDDAVIPALKLDLFAEKTGWPGQGPPHERERMPGVLLSPLRSWLRHERVQALFEGRVSTTTIRSRKWRSDPCSRKQLAYLDEQMSRVDPSYLDDGLRRRIELARDAALDSLSRDPQDLDNAFRKGDLSDLIDVVRGLL